MDYEEFRECHRHRLSRYVNGRIDAYQRGVITLGELIAELRRADEADAKFWGAYHALTPDGKGE